MFVTYSLLMQFIQVRSGLTQEEMGCKLPPYGGKKSGVDKATISNYIRGVYQVKKEVTKEVFYDVYFTDLEYVNQETVDALVAFLKEFKAWKQDYELYLPKDGNDNKKECESFIRFIIDKAEECRARGIRGEKLNIKGIDSEHETASVEFEKFNCDDDEMLNFVGREALIELIGKKLDEYSFVILYGMGGMGKTRSALKYAHDNTIGDTNSEGKYKQFQQVFFTTDLKTTLLNVRFINNDSPFENHDEELERRLKWLEGLDCDTLLIIDNMDTKPSEADQKILHRLEKMRVHILITSRNRLNDLNDRYLIEITTMSPQEQLQLFELHYQQNPFSVDELFKIFNKVDGHTMLIEMIAKTMQTNYMNPDEMLKSLEDGDNEVVDKINIEKDNEYKQEWIYAYISKLFDISNMEPQLKNILIALSLSSITGISPKVLQTLLQLPSVREINSLIDQSWIIRDKAGARINQKIHLHPAVRTAVLNSAKPKLNDLEEYINMAIQVFDSGLAGQRTLSNDDRQDIYDILDNAWTMFSKEYSMKNIKLLCSQVRAISSDSKSNYSKNLKQMFDVAINLLLQKKKYDGDEDLPGFYKANADLCVRLAAQEEAEDNYKKSIDLFKREKRYHDLASAYNGLANLYRKNAQYDNAKKIFGEAEQIVQKHSIQDVRLEANIWNNMGILYLNIGELDKALDYYEKARELRERMPESDKQKKDLAYSFHNIATVYQMKKKYSEAFQWRKKAFDIREDVYSGDDPILADSLTMMGNDIVWEFMDQNEKRLQKEKADKINDAKNYIYRGLDIRRNTLGEEHPATAWSYQSLGTLFFYLKDYENALINFNNCLSIRKKRLNEKHSYTAKALYWIGSTYFEMKEMEKAAASLNEAYLIQKEKNYVNDMKKTKAKLDLINRDLKKSVPKARSC